MDFMTRAKQLQGEMVAWRRHIHAQPEVGSNLPQTMEFVRAKLDEFGYQTKEISPCSLVAEISGPVPGKCILLREDMDALPIPEQTTLAFKSDNGYMHACGHDIHTAMLLACAKLLREYKDCLEGTVRMLFQADEETLNGANAAIAAGVLDGVDAAVTLHVDALSPWKLGVLTMAKPGVILASCDHYRIDIIGKGGHGAYPNQAVDPINVGAHIHIALQEIMSRELNASDTAVLTQGIFHSGEAANIIPHTAYLEGTIRTYDEKVRQFILRRMGEICENVALAFRAQANVTIIGGCASFKNDEALFGVTQKYLKELVGKDGYVREGEAGVAFASEDFANVSQLVPTVQMCLVLGSEQDGCTAPMHHPQVVFAEEPIYIGAAALSYSAVRYLQDHK